MQHYIENLIKFMRELFGVNSPKFVSFTYTDKKHGETSRRVLLVGEDYVSLMQKALLEIVLTEPSEIGFPLDIATQAKADCLASLNERIKAHSEGKQSINYTKAGLYRSICSGVKILETDGTLELCGVEQSKIVIVKGVYKQVNSKPLTLAKNAFMKRTRLGKYKTLCLDSGNALQAKFNGETLTF